MRQTITVYIIQPWTIRDGKLIGPMTLIREGVACGSGGCIFWASHILKENAAKWENVPVCLNHPMAGGVPVSINHSSETRSSIIGTVQNPRYDSVKKGIKGEIHIPADHPRASEIQNIKEISMGVFSDEVYESGEFKGKEYHACSITMEPDHCALLSDGQVGACDWESGCGIRTNSQSKAFQEAVREAAKTHFQTFLKGDQMNLNEVEPLLPPGVEKKEEPETKTQEWTGPGIEPMLSPEFNRNPEPETKNETKNETKPETQEWNGGVGGTDDVEPLMPIFNR